MADSNTFAKTGGSPAKTAPPLKKDLGIPHHMQDKDGFCGAACIMMLLAPSEIMKSQSEIMRLIKEKRDDQKTVRDALKTPAKGDSPASSRIAWHASPEEIALVMADLSGTPEWTAAHNSDAKKIIEKIGESIDAKSGAIALVWAPNTGMALPHWVVITGKTTSLASNTATGFLILDPTAPGRPNAALRYEAIEHKLIGKPEKKSKKDPIAKPNEKPEEDPEEEPDTCTCQSWLDDSGREHTAVRNWVPVERLEEMLDEAAVRSVGLRYAIVMPDSPDKIGKSALAESKDDRKGAELTVEDKIRRRRLREKARIFLKMAQNTGGLHVHLADKPKNPE